MYTLTLSPNMEPLQSLGWTVIRAWEHEIKADHDIVAKRVTEAINALKVEKQA